MKTFTRLLAVSAITALAVPLVPQPALADTTTEPAAIGAYFWAGKLPSTFSVGGQTQPNPINGQDTDLDGVAREDLAVAVTTPGQTDKESFLAWDLMELTENDTITKFVVTSPLSENGPSNDQSQNTYTYGVEPALQACSPKGGFGPTDAGAYETKPEVDLTKCAPGKISDDGKAYVFDVTMLASTWLTAENYGIALVPVDTATSFQVAFQPTEKHVAAIEYTKGEDPFADLPIEEPLDFGEEVVTGGGFDGGSIDSGFSGSVDTGAVDSPVVDTALPEPAAEAAPEPVAAPVETQQVALTQVPSTPPLSFWLLALAIGAVLLLVSLVTGAGRGSAQRREGRVLAQIQRGSAGPGYSPRPTRGFA